MRYQVALLYGLLLLGCNAQRMHPDQPSTVNREVIERKLFDRVFERIAVKSFEKPTEKEYSMRLLGYSGSPGGIVILDEIGTKESYLYTQDDAGDGAFQKWPPANPATLGIYRIRVTRIYRAKSRADSRGVGRELDGSLFVEGEVVGKRTEP